MMMKIRIQMPDLASMLSIIIQLGANKEGLPAREDLKPQRLEARMQQLHPLRPQRNTTILLEELQATDSGQENPLEPEQAPQIT